MVMIEWLYIFLGLDNVSGPYYAFWSGFGSDITEFAILGSLITIYRHHKCAKCWRIAHHPVEHTHYKTCHKHATEHIHESLEQKHAKLYPEQHKLLTHKIKRDKI